MKKLICIILLFTLFSGYAYAFPADLDDIPYTPLVKSEETEITVELSCIYTLLNNLGIVQEELSDLKMGNTVTKGYAASLFAKATFTEVHDSNERYFTDVSQKHQYADYINYLVSLDIIGAESGKFYPEANLTLLDAVKTAMNILGFNKYPKVQYMTEASRHGLLKNIDRNAEYMSVSQLFTLIFNMLNAYTVDFTSIDSNGGYTASVDESETYLEKNRGIRKIEGIVTGVGGMLMYGASELPEGRIEINRTVFKMASENDVSFVGKRVIALSDKDGTVICLFENTAVNKMLTVSGNEILAVSDNLVKYRDESDNTKTVRLSDAIVFLNNEKTGTLTETALKSADHIEFICNSNKDYSVVKLYDYERNVIKKISPSTMKLTLKYGGAVLELQNSDYTLILDNQKIEFSDLKVNDVISVVKTSVKNGSRRYIIYVSRIATEGKIEVVNNASGRTYYTIGGKTYEATDEFLNFIQNDTMEQKPDFSTDSVFLLSHDNKLVYAQTQTEYSYGFLMAWGEKTGSFDKTHSIMLYTIDGIKTELQFAENVKFFNAVYPGGEKVSSKEAYSYISGREMVAYKVNEEGLLTMLALPLDRTAYSPATIDYPLTIDFITTPKSSARRLYRGVYVSKYNFNTSKCLVYPEDEKLSANERAYQIKSGAGWGTDKYFSNETVTLYNVSKFCVPQFYTVSSVSQTGENISSDLRPAIIDSVSRAVKEDGEEGVLVTYYQSSVQEKAFISDNVEFVKETEGGSFSSQRTSAAELQSGDIMQFEKDSLGEIKLIRVLFNAQKTQNYYCESIGSPGTKVKTADLFSSLLMIYAQVEDIETSNILVNTSDSGTDVSYLYPGALGHGAYGGIRYYLYDTGNERASYASRDEVQKGDKVVMRKTYNHVCDVFIIR